MCKKTELVTHSVRWNSALGIYCKNNLTRMTTANLKLQQINLSTSKIFSLVKILAIFRVLITTSCKNFIAFTMKVLFFLNFFIFKIISKNKRIYFLFISNANKNCFNFEIKFQFYSYINSSLFKTLIFNVLRLK